MQPDPSSGVQALFATASQHHRAGRLADAEKLYRQILMADAQHADALHLLGVLAHQLGRHEAAVDLMGKAIAQNGKVPAFHNNLGNAMTALGRLDDAGVCYVQAILLKQDYAEAHYNLGVTLQTQGRFDAAATSYRRAVSHKPNHAAAYGNLGNVLQEQGKLDEAVAAYRKALSHRPDYAEAQGNLANVYKLQGRLVEAAEGYARALSVKPQYAEGHNNLGLVLMAQGKLEEAVASFERALSLKSDYAEAYNNLGNALRELGRRDMALACYERAVAIKSDFAEARLGLTVGIIPLLASSAEESVMTSEFFSQSLQELHAWDAARPGLLGKSVGVTQPFYLAYRPQDVTGVLCRYGDVVGNAAAKYWQPSAAHRPPTDGRPARERVRLGIVSGQVRKHPVWDVILRGIVANIDRRQFEVVLFHTGALVDEETAWARTHVDTFVHGPRSVKGWLEEIASARPDALFYPEVGMDPATGALAALRMAPLQIAGWGHPVTTGLPSMDIFLSGELLEGEGAQRHYRERLVRLPGTGVCMEATSDAVQPWKGPERLANVVRFALCQQPIKFDPADDALFARIAKAVGPSEFWLVAPHNLEWTATRLHERLAAAFRAEGVDPDAHLRVTPWMPREQFAGFMDEMDMLLDCAAFSGYTTAWAAVHRGLPIVTVEGEFLRQRLAAGLLRQIGLAEGIATSRDQYVEIAARWGQSSRNRAGWAARREETRQAACKAEGDRSAVVAFEAALVAALGSPALHSPS
jgi:protein O-GlcNAc transferase